MAIFSASHRVSHRLSIRNAATALAVSLLLVATAQAADAPPKPEAVRYHGANWIQLGPGVITNCSTARLRLSRDTMDSVLITEPVKIAAVKRWAFRYVYSRLDLSPEEPIEGDGRPVPFLSLYSLRFSLSTPRFDYSTGTAIFIRPELKIDEALLLYIPLLPEVLGLTPAECEQEIEELRKLTPAE